MLSGSEGFLQLLASGQPLAMHVQRQHGHHAFLTDLFSPVFNIEILDATELIGVVGHERELERTGVRRDEEIVCTDHRSMSFERRTDLGIVRGCFVRKVQNLDVPQILVSSMILLSSGRHFNPEQQLRLGDDGDADGADGHLLQPSQNRVMGIAS